MSTHDGLGLIKILDVRITYNEIHRTIRSTATKIRDEFGPDIMIAIGGGGFFPARVLRTFLKTPCRKNIPIQAIGLSLYEELGTALTNGLPSTEQKVGKEVVRTQWLDFSTLGHTPLLGRRILIVDEVDDTRTTLSYAVAELEKDVKAQLEKLSEDERKKLDPTEFAIFVVHNKDKPKSAQIPDHVKYFAGKTIGDQWVDYPWEATDIDEHERLANSSSEQLTEVLV
ncbi:uncharacterized protein MELLADRAFT_86888 [Melampsora larici-populina 98AG31]|uniref:Phosphoribosyltransferase domain-containing protein n=1 Tax=Melampsora larici-populina (strain 98AG31 / pathotype 3-4-7) TaxID=747676 RepID=F4R3R4_MELLP|nr:uncharacterized protein MELLADRAFT_86888 [Melampsora larici-populina 98AG31]EGG13122.1 hypothetical protein MELLADRAFT_86888 [Melampsora larici-populina 98AG31]